MTTEIHERPLRDLPTGWVTFLLVPSQMLGFFDPVAEPFEQLDPRRYEELHQLGRSMDPREVFLADDLAADAS